MKSIKRSAFALSLCCAAFAVQAGELALQVGIVRVASVSNGVQHLKLATKASVDSPETVVSVTHPLQSQANLAAGDVVMLVESGDSKVWILPMGERTGPGSARN